MNKFILFFLFFSNYAFSEFLVGKITQTEGHLYPNCRIVALSYEEGGVFKKKFFRIKHVEGSDINSIALTALVADKRVRVNFTPGEGSGCGAEDKINYITVFRD